jgi:hypothetical protein
VSQYAPSHVSRSAFSDIYMPRTEERSAPSLYFNPRDNPSDRGRYASSAGHSRTGTATTIVAPTLPEVAEETFDMNAWVRDVQPPDTRPLTSHREYFAPTATEQRESSGHEYNPSYGRRDQTQRASYPGSIGSQPPHGQGQ